jgi:hypothetical protein
MKAKTRQEKYFESMMTVALGRFLDQTKPNEEVFAIASVLFNGFVFGAVAATFSSISTFISNQDNL